jgi:RNase P subunit RPR2
LVFTFWFFFLHPSAFKFHPLPEFPHPAGMSRSLAKFMAHITCPERWFALYLLYSTDQSQEESMPPFVSTDCPHCEKTNRFDVVELQKNSGVVYKDVLESRNAEEFFVTCQHCGKGFKFTLNGGIRGQNK